jgi:hypothetical protein
MTSHQRSLKANLTSSDHSGTGAGETGKSSAPIVSATFRARRPAVGDDLATEKISRVRAVSAAFPAKTAKSDKFEDKDASRCRKLWLESLGLPVELLRSVKGRT